MSELAVKTSAPSTWEQATARLPFISVIVPVRNEARFIGETLRQLLEQRYDADRFEVLVADGGSTDDTWAVVAALQCRHPNLHLLPNPHHWSSAGRNTAIRAARGEIIVLVDGHCELEDAEYLREMASAFERSGADCVGRPQPLDVTGATILQRAIAIARASRLGHHPDSYIYSDCEAMVPPDSVAVAYRRSVFERIGLFDERFDACEDVELNHRAARAGLRCFLTPRVRVHYHPRGSLTGLFRQMVRYGRGRVRLLRKHSDTFSLKSLLPGAFLGGLCVGPQLALAWPMLWFLYGGVLACYALIVLLFSAGLALRERRLALFPWLPLVFPMIHLGAGYGILREGLGGRSRPPKAGSPLPLYSREEGSNLGRPDPSPPEYRRRGEYERPPSPKNPTSLKRENTSQSRRSTGKGFPMATTATIATTLAFPEKDGAQALSPLNALTIDVEDYYHVSGFEKIVSRNEWDGYESRVAASTLRILALLARAEVRATFYVLGWVAERQPRLVRSIRAAGHEVGCHSYEHRLIYTQTPAEFRADLRRARDVLQDILGEPVTAYRAPSFSITRQSEWALDLLIEEGFTTDSSIYPTHHDRYGLPGTPLGPHAIHRANGSLWEFPPPVWRILGYPLPVGGGGYFRLYPYALTRHGLAAVNRAGRPFAVYLHPWEFDPEQPRLRPGWLRGFRHYVNLHRTESRLGRLLDDFTFGTLSEALARWRGDSHVVQAARAA
jgi:polysaccharide deacetylase family protein (PEP-CTERM system associated)